MLQFLFGVPFQVLFLWAFGVFLCCTEELYEGSEAVGLATFWHWRARNHTDEEECKKIQTNKKLCLKYSSDMYVFVDAWGSYFWKTYPELF